MKLYEVVFSFLHAILYVALLVYMVLFARNVEVAAGVSRFQHRELIPLSFVTSIRACHGSVPLLALSPSSRCSYRSGYPGFLNGCNPSTCNMYQSPCRFEVWIDCLVNVTDGIIAPLGIDYPYNPMLYQDSPYVSPVLMHFFSGQNSSWTSIGLFADFNYTQIITISVNLAIYNGVKIYTSTVSTQSTHQIASRLGLKSPDGTPMNSALVIISPQAVLEIDSVEVTDYKEYLYLGILALLGLVETGVIITLACKKKCHMVQPHQQHGEAATLISVLDK